MVADAIEPQNRRFKGIFDATRQLYAEVRSNSALFDTGDVDRFITDCDLSRVAFHDSSEESLLVC